MQTRWMLFDTDDTKVFGGNFNLKLTVDGMSEWKLAICKCTK